MDDQRLEEIAKRMFPILDGPAIPWSVIEPWEKFARMNHGQTLERLAERGGLACAEAIAVLRGERHRAVAALTTSEARAVLMRLVEQRTEMVPRLIHNMVQQERDDALEELRKVREELRSMLR
jgi:hypothetical protein